MSQVELSPTGPASPEDAAAPEVSIVVPITSKFGRPREVVEALSGELERLGKTWEAILVFDGVKGAQWEEGLLLQEQTGDQVRTIALNKPFGESVCLGSAFEHARGAIILTSPEYVQVDPRAVEALLTRLDEGSEFATSWRHPRVGPTLRNGGSTRPRSLWLSGRSTKTLPSPRLP